MVQGLTGEVITPQNPLYNDARQGWNRAVQKFPLAIVYCTNREDISNAIHWARRHCIPLRIRSGGHNYEGYSNGNGALVIDVSRMQGMWLNGNLLTIEPGVQFRVLYEYVTSLGYPFPGGECPTVGAVGYTLGGGWGLSARRYGLGSDSLLEAELMDFNGHILRANAQCHPDLFRALQGSGGGNFGVVVSMTYRLPPRVERVTYITFNYENTDQRKQCAFLAAWQRFLPCLDERLTAIAGLYRSAKDGFGIFGRALFYGPPNEARSAMRPLDSVPGGSYSYQYLSLYDTLQQVMEEFPPYELFKSTSRFVMHPLDAHTIGSVTGLIRTVPEGSVYSALTLFTLGGQVAKRAPSSTAYFYRKALYLLGIQSVWEDPQYTGVNSAWVNQQFQYLKKVTQGSFVNFPINELPDYMQAYYGGNVAALQSVNRAYDPNNVFCYPQCIR